MKKASKDGVKPEKKKKKEVGSRKCAAFTQVIMKILQTSTGVI